MSLTTFGRRCTSVAGPVAAMLLLLGCGSSAGPAASSSAAANAPVASPIAGGGAVEPSTGPAASSGADAGAGSADLGGGPIGGTVGDRSKGSIQATVTGGYSASIDLPYGAALGNLGINGPNTAYLPFTDEKAGTVFLTISEGDQLLVQYAGPDNVGITSGATPCELHLSMDATQAKGTFTCKGLMVIKGESIGSADMTGSFEAHK